MATKKTEKKTTTAKKTEKKTTTAKKRAPRSVKKEMADVVEAVEEKVEEVVEAVEQPFKNAEEWWEEKGAPLLRKGCSNVKFYATLLFDFGKQDKTSDFYQSIRDAGVEGHHVPSKDTVKHVEKV